MYPTLYMINSHFIVYSFFYLFNKSIIFTPIIVLVKNYYNRKLSNTVEKILSQSRKSTKSETSIAIYKNMDFKYYIRNLDSVG